MPRLMLSTAADDVSTYVDEPYGVWLSDRPSVAGGIFAAIRSDRKWRKSWGASPATPNGVYRESHVFVTSFTAAGLWQGLYESQSSVARRPVRQVFHPVLCGTVSILGSKCAARLRMHQAVRNHSRSSSNNYSCCSGGGSDGGNRYLNSSAGQRSRSR